MNERHSPTMRTPSEKSRNLGPQTYEVFQPDMSSNIPEGKTGLPSLDAAREIEKLIYIDPLTGCYNRKYFENFKQNNFDPERDNNNIGLIMVDNNRFKEVNDNFGHDAGDQVLKDTVKLLRATVRKSDVVVRMGGDEFIVICHNHEKDPNFKQNLPLKITDRLNKNLSVQKFEYQIDLAYGIAVYDKTKDNGDIDQTYKRADILMYHNKNK